MDPLDGLMYGVAHIIDGVCLVLTLGDCNPDLCLRYLEKVEQRLVEQDSRPQSQED